MKKRLTVLLMLTTFAVAAGDAPGVVIWKNGMPPGGLKERSNFANHLMMVSHRDKDGVAEYHEKQTDIMVIKSGQAVLEIGGEMVNAKTTAPGEMRAPSIKGGVKHPVMAGDVIHVPSKTPHQFFVKPGTTIDYFVVKVDNP